MKSKFLKLLNKKVDITRETLTTLLVLVSLTIGVGYVVASDGSTIGNGGVGQIVGPNSVCKKVTNSSVTGLSVYIPTASSAEWADFYAKPPSGVTATICTCNLPWGGTINDGQSRTAYQASSVPYGSSCVSQTRTCNAGTLSGAYQYSSCTVQACSGKGCPCTGKGCSDARLKQHISSLNDARGLDAILNLRPVLFRWKDVNQDAAEGPQIGFIAQDLEQIFPEVVNTNDGVVEVRLEDGKTELVANPKTVQYANLVAPLVKAVQQLNAENVLLKKRLEILEEKVQHIEGAVGK